MADVTLPLIGALTIVLLWFWFKDNKNVALIEKIPGPKAYPIVGNIFDVSVPTNEVIERSIERKKQYGDILRLWFGNLPVVSVSSPEYVEKILSSTSEIHKNFTYKFVKNWLGDGLLISTGQKWTKHRKLITPTFHFKILESFVEVFERKSEILVKKLKEESKTGKSFDVYPFITRCALDIICDTAMGINLNAQDNMDNEYLKAVYNEARLISERIVQFYYFSDFIYNLSPAGKESKKCVETLHNFTETIIKERRASRSASKEAANEDDFGIKKKKAFLDLLLDQEDQLTDTEIREEVDTFMFGGHDTTTVSMSWSIFLLGLNPEIQNRAAEEVLSVWPKGEPLTLQILAEMKYLERCIKESMRLYPSAPIIGRKLKNELQIGKYLIPAGTNLSVMISVLHLDEKSFPDPRKYDPDRFLPENVAKRHPYSYVPFSAGPRNCIGQKFAMLEEKAILAAILREFRVRSMKKREEIKVVSEVVGRPENGVEIQLLPRS